MDGLILRLMPTGREFETQELVLQSHRIESSILDTANRNSSLVYCDYEYTAQLLGILNNSISDLKLLLNGSEIDYAFAPDSGLITFGKSQKDRRIFSECYGFIQFAIIFTDVEGTHFLETEYVQVMVKKSRRNESVRRMTEYVYKENTALLYGNRLTSKNSAGLKENTSKTLETKILLLKQITRTFEENYRYFRTNSRFVTVQKEYVDHFEKLQYVSTKTLQHIAQHPEELYRVPTSAGIKIGVNRYQPSKTLITKNVKSFDIYENQVIVGFLNTINRELDIISRDINNIVEKMPVKPIEKNEYVTSSFFIYADTVNSLRIVLEDIRVLKSKCESLYYAYQKILPVIKLNVCDVPKFTPIFKSIPQYHQIYDCIASWFMKGAFSLDEEKYMLTFQKISNLYEVYVLAKIINYYRKDGYSLKETKKLTYSFNTQTLYENTTCNNVYILQNEKTTVTVYYQPVIYNFDTLSEKGIGLYRNTSISFNKTEEDISRPGKYYTPDYLIKYEYSDQAGCEYIIADAKFSTINTVRNIEVPKLTYKYLFSISSCIPEDKIIELCIFNGQSEYDNDGVTNIYDLSQVPRNIMPQAEIVTLTENSEDNEALHHMIMRGTIGKYRTRDYISFINLPSPSNNRQDETAEQIPGIIQQNELAKDNSKNATDMTDSESEGKRTKKEKKKKEKEIDPLDIQVVSLPLRNNLAQHLVDIGYPTFRELIPNIEKKDLNEVQVLNRKQRREIEANINLILRIYGKKLK